MTDDLRQQFDEATRRGDLSVVSRWLLEPGGICRVAEFAVLRKPDYSEIAKDYAVNGHGVSASLRMTPGQLAALRRYCADHYITRAVALRRARAEYPGSGDVERLMRLVGDEA
jgi:hypothetical protein